MGWSVCGTFKRSPLLFNTRGAPAATAPAVVGTAVALLAVIAPVKEADERVVAPVTDKVPPKAAFLLVLNPASKIGGR